MFDISSERIPPWGGAGDRSCEAALLGQDSGAQERLHERHDALVPDPLSRLAQNGRVRERVEARLDVGLDDPLVGAAREVVDLGDRVLGSASGPKAVRSSSSDTSCSW
jgi:hypothetical protein